MERTTTDWINGYLGHVTRALNELPREDLEKVIDELLRAYVRGSQVFVLGNGGSAATASHFACDLGKGTAQPGRQRFRVISLTDNVSLMTAWANDAAYEDIFVEQLANLLEPRDVVIGISGSGNSPNVLKALKYAREVGARTIAFTGFAGGMVKDLADLSIIARADHMGQIEDVHLIIAHIAAYYLRDKLAEQA